MKDRGYFAGCAAFIVLALTVLVSTQASKVPDSFAAYICQSEQCTIQSWILTVGTIGAFAAAIWAGFVGLAQLAHTQRQTDFILGDADPEAEIFQPASNSEHAIFELVNYNRRIAIIRQIEVLDQAGVKTPSLTHLLIENDCLELRPNGRPYYSSGCRGWRNKNDAPSSVRFSFVTSEDTHDLVARNPRAPVRVRVLISLESDGSRNVEKTISLLRVELFRSDFKPD